MTNPAYEATNSDVRMIAITKQLSSLMVERFTMNPISAKILREDWEKEFPDNESIAQRFNALIAALEAENALNKHLDLAIRKAEGCSEALRRRAEAAENRRDELESAPNGMMQLSNELTEMKRKCAELQEQKDKWAVWAIALGAKADELEFRPLCVKSNDAMREAAPLYVKLPDGSKPSVIRGGQQSTSYRAIMSGSGDWLHKDMVIEAIRAAGGTVEGE
ncbi:hypothetical protein EC843_1011020 [Buttiauxella sp. JUb87]|uniref:hypothetical protein n=1 Tax=Buttiauxella sp. JUb87 TaxID=2485129 RepID=UPI00105F8C73|nr:hypothetical protein [Buttiauxella sp. JUb87]TDN54961.1 hypothetical protein EC843_1011020 [Buttiauxella sp. JUb87]